VIDLLVLTRFRILLNTLLSFVDLICYDFENGTAGLPLPSGHVWIFVPQLVEPGNLGHLRARNLASCPSRFILENSHGSCLIWQESEGVEGVRDRHGVCNAAENLPAQLST
jgi:hypothetical protein